MKVYEVALKVTTPTGQLTGGRLHYSNLKKALAGVRFLLKTHEVPVPETDLPSYSTVALAVRNRNWWAFPIVDEFWEGSCRILQLEVL